MDLRACEIQHVFNCTVAYPNNSHSGTIRLVPNRTSSTAAVTLSLSAIGIISMLLMPQAISSEPTPYRSMIPLLPEWIFFSALALIGGVLLVSAGVLFREMLRRASAPDMGKILGRRRMLRVIIGATAAFFVFYIAAALILSFLRVDEEVQDQARNITEELVDLRAEKPDEELPEPPDSRQYLVSANKNDFSGRSRVVAFLTTIAAFGVAVFVGMRAVRSIRREPVQVEDDATDGFRRELLNTARDVLERLVEQGDDRGAIIAAYAMVESTFAGNGFTREPWQTPKEFFDETITVSGVISTDEGRRSLTDLALLYEVAKFSDHPLGEHDRRRAISLLERIERELSSTTPTSRSAVGR